MRSPGTAAAVLCLLLCAGCAAVPRGARSKQTLTLAYELTYRTAPHAIDVEVTLNGPAREFYFTRTGGVREVTAISPDREHRVRVRGDGRVPLPEETSRLRYRYEIPDDASVYSGAGGPGSIVIAGREYLIRPRVADGVTATLRIRGAEVLLPWSPDERGAWHLRGEDLVDSGFHSFGGRRCTAEVDGATLEVALHEGERSVSDEFICEWLRGSAYEVLTVRRPFPFQRITVHVLPVDSADPSPLGLMLWSTPPSLALLVGRHAQAPAFRRDWVAVHELLHTVHPAFMHKAPWLSEGLATYYTEVARMRSGRQTEEEGWRELASGFERGRRDCEDCTLDETVEALRRGVYLPVYWAGALLVLDVDLEVRRATGNQKSLDDVLALLATWGVTSNVEQFGRAVDTIAAKPLWREIFERHAEGPTFRTRDALLKQLGVELIGDHVRFTSAPDAQLRDAIGEPRSSTRGH